LILFHIRREQMATSKWFDNSWKPNVVRYEETDQDLTAAAGMGTIIDLFFEMPYYRNLRECLPLRDSNSSYETRHLAFVLLCGFWYGYDCLDDLEKFRGDPLVLAKLGEIPRAKTIGDYLRDFDDENIRKLNEFLTMQALQTRARIGATGPITLDIDSTPNEQSGKKIEGVAWNYKDQWCLDTLLVYDELGLCYGMILRPGNTFSSQGGDVMLRDILKNIPVEQRKEITVRADSAFCNQDFVEMCLLMQVKFSITAHGNMGWEKEVLGLSYKEWLYSSEEIIEAREKKIEIPKIETSFYLYEPGWAPNLKFPVVVKRTWVKETKDGVERWYWKYYAVITNRGLYPLTTQTIMEFHAKRGNSENFIREDKYGYDLKHYPCQKLKANHAYGLLARVAANFLRGLQIVQNPDRPSFAKKLRHRLIAIPGKLISRSGKTIMKIPTTHYKERESMITAWQATLNLSFSTA
jgi:hypothetical protein